MDETPFTPFSIPEHGSKTGSNSNFEGARRGRENIEKKNPCTQKKRGKNGKKTNKRQGAQVEGIGAESTAENLKQKYRCPIVAMSSQEKINGNHMSISSPSPPRHYLVELLRCMICTLVALVPLPTDRRRGRISLPLPLLRRRPVLRIEPRRRVWSKRTFSR